MTAAIKIENLSKKYVIGHQRQERYVALRDVMMHKIRGIGQRLRHPLSPNREEVEAEEFWALKDINLDILQGDRVGIIGRNGAGKSTLLKVLSRITEPTSGKIQLNGRVASLLEVGTGFHPELSGRENIYLNGAILGMGRNEIKRKFDEIVDFSGVEKFLDTPVKRYSSGMYMRLAFAVAAHLEPEILIVDEVLAVGDAQFQKKCLGKMEDVSKEGRTVLFVSHNMNAIKYLTRQCVVLMDGRVSYIGDPPKAIDHYFAKAVEKPRANVSALKIGLEGFSIEELYCDESRLEKGFNQPIFIGMHLNLKKEFKNVNVGFGVVNSIGSRILTMERTIPSILAGRSTLELRLENHKLAPGNYSLSIGMSVAGGGTLIYQENVLEIELPYTPEDGAYLAKKSDRIGVFHQPTYTLTPTK